VWRGGVKKHEVESLMNLGLIFKKKPGWSETFLQTQVEQLDAIPIYLDEMEFPANPTWPHELSELLGQRKLEACLLNYGTMAARIAPVLIQAGVRYVVHFHGVDAHRNVGMEEVHKKFPLMLRGATGVVVVSSAMQRAIEAWGVPTAKIHLNPYGIPRLPEEVAVVGGARRDAHLIVCVGRFVEKKAPYLVLTAFREVWLKNPELRLQMVGDGEFRVVCEAMVKGWSMTGAVEFLGVRDRTAVLQLMGRAAVLVQHSVTAQSGDMEGTPNTILEAAAMACPIVATRHAGISDVIPTDEFGLLVDEYDVAGMAQALRDTLERPEEAAQRASLLQARVTSEYQESRYLEGLRKCLDLAVQAPLFDEELRAVAREAQAIIPKKPKATIVKEVKQKKEPAKPRGIKGRIKRWLRRLGEDSGRD
jgi:colanic acid/amylovoran biosynthesis glycosyltransferase